MSKKNASHIQILLSHVAPNVIVIKYTYSPFVQVTCHLSSDTAKQQQHRKKGTQCGEKKIRKLSIGDWYSIQILRNRHIMPQLHVSHTYILYIICAHIISLSTLVQNILFDERKKAQTTL